ncbi:hypothetical protein D3C75_752460 [compost metagenome]
MAAGIVQQRLLAEQHVVFHLDRRQWRAQGFHHLAQQPQREVGHADAARLALVTQGHQGFDAAGQVPVLAGPVDVEQVDLLGTQRAQAVLQRLAHGLGRQAIPPYLGGQVNLLARYIAVAQGLADGGFVVIGSGGVDVPVTHFKRLAHGLGALAAGHWPGAQADGGQGQAVTGGEPLHVNSL